ncbi:MAG: hypothetical protein M1825_002526 [Sarcosagium campestre]|nr:MAG: hypothetical protein M1825_002526 [Sarcosagium campestre]
MAESMDQSSVTMENCPIPRSPPSQQSLELRPENIPLPTDSMVTIRLSDPLTDPGLPISDEVQITSSLNTPSHGNTESGGDLEQVVPQTDISAGEDCCEVFDSLPNSTYVDTAVVEEPEIGMTNLSRTDRPRSSSAGSHSSQGSGRVDWDGLEKTEEEEPKEEGSDQSVAFLLARLEQENNAIATDPKANLTKSRPEPSFRKRSQSRPPSIHHLQKLVTDQTSPSLRYSLLPTPPPMTDLEFYAALVTDYPRTAQCLPTLLLRKIRSGIPPPLRGVVWMSMSGARDRLLEDQYDRLASESSPYENMISKDIGRSFPGVEMFRDPDGDGQRMLGRVLKCFSLYDHKIGYCQGLGFLVGPLLMNMGDKEAFCVLVRLMEHYDLRSCFLPDLSGLHLRIYQFQRLLAVYLPAVTSHFERLQIEGAYVSQWFLSFFAVTCPVPMLLRIYDVIFAEGASETMMRVALSLMKRNEAKILASTEFEDVMQLLLSRSLWDAYGCNADDLVDDFVALTGVVTHEGLQLLEAGFREAKAEGSTAKVQSLPDLQAAASRFLGRLWTGSNSSTKSATLSANLAAPSRPSSFLRRTPSKQSIASTLNSCEGGSDSAVSSVPTEATTASRQSSSADSGSVNSLSGSVSFPTTSNRRTGSSKDRDLHSQIEDLLTALSEMQRDHAMLDADLQREREEREEDRRAITPLLQKLRKQSSMETLRDSKDGKAESAVEENAAVSSDEDIFEELEVLQQLASNADEHFSSRRRSNRCSINETKHQLRDELKRSQKMFKSELSKCQELDRRLSEQCQEISNTKEQLRDARLRLQQDQRERQRLEKVVQELRLSNPAAKSAPESPTIAEGESADHRSSVYGLREFKLRTSTTERSQTSATFSKRSSSLNTQTVPIAEAEEPRQDDGLLAELVASKTAEAVAKQEAEELRAKLESLRKLLGASGKSGTGGSHQSRPSQPTLETSVSMNRSSSSSSSQASSATTLATPASSSSRGPSPVSAATSVGSGFWGGWGKRSFSSNNVFADTRSS